MNAGGGAQAARARMVQCPNGIAALAVAPADAESAAGPFAVPFAARCQGHTAAELQVRFHM